jgi:hypothetical protein
MRRKKVHVTPRDRGKWAVKVSGNSRASSTHRKKSAAKRKARKKAKRIARKGGKSELVIHKSNGAIQKKHSYGKDPERYSG